jgi:hypothetical protein
MLQIYLGALAFGGTLLIASLFLGSKDADHDHGDGDGEHEAHGAADGFAWLPVTSLRFWTFVLAFGGIAGALLTWLGGIGEPIVGVAALAVGWGSGLGMNLAMRGLRKGSVGSEVALQELSGETAQVVVALRKDQIGKVRLSAKGRVLDLLAETDDPELLAVGSSVMIVGEGEQGRVQVTRPVT